MTYRISRPLPVLGGALAALLAGCGAAPPDVPQGALHPVSTQKTARAVQHWNVMADDVAAHVAERLRDWPADKHAIYVVVPPGESGFDAGFRQLLTTRLLQRGLTLATEPTPLRLQVQTQLVQHHANAPLVASGSRLGGGVSVQRGAQGYAPASAATGPMRSEILVTTSLENEGRFIVRTGDVYSVPQDDAGLYEPLIALPTAAPTPVKTWQVTP